MNTLLHKFSLESAKFTTEVIFAVLLVWAVVVACAIASILSQPFTARQRLFWIATVTLLPLVGLLAYLPFSFRREDLPQLFMMKRASGKRQAAQAKRLTKGPNG